MSFIKPLVLIALLLTFVNSAFAGSISGNLVMPTPYSQSADMTISVRAVSPNDPTPRQQQLVISMAEAGAGNLKAFTISGLVNGETYTLQYDCNSFSSLEQCKNIVPRGYYLATSQATVRAENGTTFSGTATTTGINLPILIGKSITGTVSLPSGVAPAAGLTFSVRAQTTASPTAMLTVGTNFMSVGTSSETFKVTIPDDVSESWTIGYICTDGGHCNNYLPFGYRKSGATNDTVEDVADADSLAGNVDSTNQDMTLLEGYSISGNITVPTPVTEAGGLVLNISIQDDNNPAASFDTGVTIPQGQTSIGYSTTVSLDGAAAWAVKYTCNTVASPIDCAPYITEGFYDDSEITNTTANIVNKDTLAGGSSHSNIDMTLLTGQSISGKLQLSDGVAPAGGIAFTLRAVDTGFNGDFATTATIAEGDTEVSYLINVEDNIANNYRVHFNCTETITVICEKLSDQRYYDATSGTTIDIEGDADPLAGDTSHTNIDLEVLSSALLDELCVPIKTSNGSLAVVCL